MCVCPTSVFGSSSQRGGGNCSSGSNAVNQELHRLKPRRKCKLLWTTSTPWVGAFDPICLVSHLLTNRKGLLLIWKIIFHLCMQEDIQEGAIKKEIPLILANLLRFYYIFLF